MKMFMATAWPSLASKQIITSMESLRINMTSDATRAQLTPSDPTVIGPPYGILWFGNARQSARGVGNPTNRLPVTFYYAAPPDQTTADDQITLSNQMWLLKDLIDSVAHPFTSCERIEFGDVNSGASLPENLSWLHHKGILQAASLSYDPGFLVGYINT